MRWGARSSARPVPIIDNSQLCAIVPGQLPLNYCDPSLLTADMAVNVYWNFIPRLPLTAPHQIQLIRKMLCHILQLSNHRPTSIPTIRFNHPGNKTQNANRGKWKYKSLWATIKYFQSHQIIKTISGDNGENSWNKTIYIYTANTIEMDKRFFISMINSSQSYYELWWW